MIKKTDLPQQTVRGKSKKWLIALSILFLFALGCFVLWHKATKPLVFNQELWDSQPMERNRMLNSLMEQYNGLNNMTKEEITELLGTNTLTVFADSYIIGRGKFGEPAITMRLIFNNEGIYSGYSLYQYE